MPGRSALLAVPLLFLAAPGCVTPAEESGALTGSPAAIAKVRQELEATFAARMRAYDAKDFATLVDQVSPAYSAIRPDGTRMTRDDLAGYIRRNLGRWVRITQQSNEIESLVLDGGNAVVDMRQQLARIQIVDGREAVVESKVLQTETWTPTDAGWKLLSVRNERDMSLTIDGRPVE